MRQCANAPMPRCPNAPMPQCPNATPNQVIRAFRLDDELRDLMLPLLNVPADTL